MDVLDEIDSSERRSECPVANTNNSKNSGTAFSKQYNLQKHGYTTQCTDNDVLLGRGYAPTLHEGNVRFRAHVATRKDEYINSKNRNNKSKIAKEVAEWVFNNNGKFIKKLELDEVLEHGLISPDEYQRITTSLQSVECTDVSIPSFYELADDETIMDKAKQALRQMEKVPRSSTRANVKNSHATGNGSVPEASVSIVSSSQRSESPTLSHSSSVTQSQTDPPDLVHLWLPNASRSTGIRSSVSFPLSHSTTPSNLTSEPVRRVTEPTDGLLQSSSDLASFFQDIEKHSTASSSSSAPIPEYDESNTCTEYDDQVDLFSGPEGRAILEKLINAATFHNTNCSTTSSPNSYPTTPLIDVHNIVQNVQQLTNQSNNSFTDRSAQDLHSKHSSSPNTLLQQQSRIMLEQQISQLAQYFPNATQGEIISFLQSIGTEETQHLSLNTTSPNNFPSSMPSAIAHAQPGGEYQNQHQPQQPSLQTCSYSSSCPTYGQDRQSDTQRSLLTESGDAAHLFPPLQFQQQQQAAAQHLDSDDQSEIGGTMHHPQQNVGYVSQQLEPEQDRTAFLFQKMYNSETKQMYQPSSTPDISEQHITNQLMFQQQQMMVLPPLEESLNESESDLASYAGDDSIDGLPKQRPSSRRDVSRLDRAMRSFDSQRSTSFSAINDNSDYGMLSYVNPELLQRITENTDISAGVGGQEFQPKPLYSLNGGMFTRRGSMGTANRRGSVGSVGVRTSTSSRRPSNISMLSFQETSMDDIGSFYQFSGMDELMDSFSLMSTDGFSTNRSNPLRMSLVTTAETLGTIDNLGNLGDSSFRTLETHLFSVDDDNADVPVNLPMLGIEDRDVQTQTMTPNVRSSVVNVASDNHERVTNKI